MERREERKGEKGRRGEGRREEKETRGEGRRGKKTGEEGVTREGRGMDG